MSSATTRFTAIGYQSLDIIAVRGPDGIGESASEQDLVDPSGVQGQENGNGDEAAWVDENMPVDPSFKHAMHDASELLRYRLIMISTW